MDGTADQFGSSSPRPGEREAHVSGAAAGSQTASHCRVCGDQGHRSRDCSYIQSDEEGIPPLHQAALEMDGVSEASLARKGYRPTRHDEEMSQARPIDLATPKRRPRRIAMI